MKSNVQLSQETANQAFLTDDTQQRLVTMVNPQGQNFIKLEEVKNEFPNYSVTQFISSENKANEDTGKQAKNPK